MIEYLLVLNLLALFVVVRALWRIEDSIRNIHIALHCRLPHAGSK